MKHTVILVFVIYLIITTTDEAGVSTITTTAPRHFQAVCLSAAEATLTVGDEFIIEGVGTCGPTSQTGAGQYKVTNDCLNGGEFIIKPKQKNTPSVSIKGGQGAKVYTMACIMGVDGETHSFTARVNIVNPTLNPVSFTYTPKPLTVHLKVSATIPTTDHHTTDVTSAYLGQQLFLAIFHDETGPRHLIPRSCTANDQTDANTSLKLWDLTSKPSCFAVSVMGGAFEAVSATDIVYAEMEAFLFLGKSQQITITCEVRLCVDITNGDCKKDSDALTACGATVTASTDRRRRRDVAERENSPSGRGNLHHVITTLHIRDDILATGSTGVIRHSVAYIIVPVLVKLFM